MNAVRAALPKLKPGDAVNLVARVSEGPEVRLKLKREIEAMLPKSSQRVCAVRVQTGRELADG